MECLEKNLEKLKFFCSKYKIKCVIIDV